MSLTRTCLAVLPAVVLVLPAAAQFPGRGGPARTDVRGVVKSVDATAGTITLAAGGGRGEPTAEKTYKVAADAEVAVDPGTGRRGVLQAAKLADLAAGTPVVLTLTADEKAVDGIVAEPVSVRGTLKAVDLEKRAITVTTFAGRGREAPPAEEEKTYAVPADAEIGVDDGKGRRFSVKEGKLADLAVGSLVTLRLSPDQKKAAGVVAEGPTLFGAVKAIDAGKKTITLSTNGGRGGEGAEDKELALAADAAILLDDGRGRRLSMREAALADVPVGSVVSARLSADQKGVTWLRAEGPSLGAMLKGVDAAKGTVTVATRVARGDNPEEKTYTVAKGVRVTVDGKDGTLADLKPGDGTFVMLRMSLDQKAVQAIMVMRPRE